MSTFVRRTLDSQGATLGYLDYGGAGPPVVLLHGLAGRATEWATTATWLADICRVIVLDQRGHGQSSGATDFSRSAYVGDVVALVRALSLAPAILVGQSMGGTNAYLTAARHPELVRALVVAEAGIYCNPGAPQQIANWLDSWPLPFADIAAAVRFFGGDTLAGRTWSEVLVSTVDGYRPEFTRQDIIASVRDAEMRSDYAAEWKSVTCPTLMVTGERGWIDAELAHMLALNPHSAHVCIAGAGHDVHLERPDLWRAAIEPFIRGLLGNHS